MIFDIAVVLVFLFMEFYFYKEFTAFKDIVNKELKEIKSDVNEMNFNLEMEQITKIDEDEDISG